MGKASWVGLSMYLCAYILCTSYIIMIAGDHSGSETELLYERSSHLNI